MQKCYIQTIELDPTLDIQPVTVYQGWGQLNGCVNYDQASNKIHMYIGYVWDDSNLSPLQQDSIGTTNAYLYNVDAEQDFDSSNSLIGTVQLPDGTIKVVMNTYSVTNSQPAEQPGSPGAPGSPSSPTQ